MTEAERAAWLLTPEAIRTQCNALFALAEADQLTHFSLNLDKLDHCADEVVVTIKANYPTLEIPPHARWRHFVFAGEDRWTAIMAGMDLTAADRARLECELAITSVLLDAGAGAAWSYRDAKTGTAYARSEGLALASLDMFMAGALGDGKNPGVTIDGLLGLTPKGLAQAFQVSDTNPLEGLEGRVALLQSLGAVIADQLDVFGETPRLGLIADHLFGIGRDDGLPARDILVTVLDVLGPIWPDRPTLNGASLGDCWTHPKAPAPGLVPFHKLSQWLSYSLVEPMERTGLPIVQLDGLTGLAEYRNGGLFLDTGVIALRDPTVAGRPEDPSGELVVEWRALTVALLDRVAEKVRSKLGKTAETMPLAAVLEGGTWATGRRLAQAKRAGGAPPISIKSTGTVF